MLSRRLLLAGLMATPFAARAQDAVTAGAIRFMQGLSQQAIATLQAASYTPEQREQNFRSLLAHGFDLDFIGRFALGRTYAQLTAEQRQDYAAAFNEFVLRTYSRRLGGYSGEQFEILNGRPAGEQDAVVASRIVRAGGPPIQVDWRVRNLGGQYKVIDVAVEGVSMVLTQRQDFTAAVGSGGVEGLIAGLRARGDRLPAVTR